LSLKVRMLTLLPWLYDRAPGRGCQSCVFFDAPKASPVVRPAYLRKSQKIRDRMMLTTMLVVRGK
jgi:hypothetical protein